MEKGEKEKFCLWLTGLPCAGKTTLGNLLKKELEKRGNGTIVFVDNDEFRKKYCRDLRFGRRDRAKNIRRATDFINSLVGAGASVIAAFVSPYKSIRNEARERIGKNARFIEVYLNCSIKECVKRDVKGMYERAIWGQIANFTGISDPYEEPENPDIIINTEKEPPERSAARIISFLEKNNLI